MSRAYAIDPATGDTVPVKRIRVLSMKIPVDAVLTTPQELTEDQKKQAHENIGTFDDTSVSNKSGWHSQQIVNRIVETVCPAFETSGAKVSFTPAQDYPFIDVVSQIDPVQTGSGTPSISNPRPVKEFDQVKLTQEAGEEKREYVAKLPAGCYGGSVDWTSKTFTPNVVRRVLSQYDGWLEGYTDPRAVTKRYLMNASKVTSKAPLCKDFPSLSQLAWDNVENVNGFCTPDPNMNLEFAARKEDYPTLDSWKAYLKEREDSGNPVVVYIFPPQPQEAVPILSADKVNPLPGINTVYSDAGNITVSGKQEFQFQKQAAALLAMFQACAFSKYDTTKEFAAFRSAFGLPPEGE